MNDKTYILNCGGLPLRYSFMYPETLRFFGDYMEEYAEADCDCQPLIRLTGDALEKTAWLVDEAETSLPFREYHALMLATGNALLSHHRALFHGAALLWRNKAWILTAPSGTGKTTQLRHWKKHLKKDVQIINGDKPLLTLHDDGAVDVSSSPWRGKENYGHPGLCAPLGGIVLLKQGKENRMERMSVSDAVRPLFSEFISFPENTEQIRHQADILNRLLDAVPVWELTNLGDPASTLLTLKTLSSYLEDHS